jgi:hypothetical protein
MKLYLLAQCYANLDVYFHIDENYPVPIKDALYSITTSDEIPADPGRFRRYAFTVYERAFLEAKCRQLLRRGIIQESRSHWSAGVLPVPYHDRIKESLQK